MRVPRSLASRAVVAAASASFALSGIAAPALADGERDTARTYVQTNLVSDVPGLAAHTDPNLRNPWGTSTGPGLPIWVSDNATGVTTLYDGQGNLKEVAANQPAVMIPAPQSARSGAVGAPTGTTFNPTPDGFVISKGGISGSSKFLFATEDGTIQPFTDTLSRLPGKHHLLVVATNDDQSIGAVKAAQASSRLGDIYIGSQGADPTSWPYMCGKTPFKNWIDDTAYFPERYGDTVVPLLLSLIDGQKEPAFVYVNHRVVSPQNIKLIYPNACK